MAMQFLLPIIIRILSSFFGFPISMHVVRRLKVMISLENIILISLPIASRSAYVVYMLASLHFGTHQLATIHLLEMALHNLWFPPAQGVVKSNVHDVVDEEPNHNGVLNSIEMVAIDHAGRFLWGVMGPMRDMKGLQPQIWVIHQAMKLAVVHNIHHSHRIR